MRRPGLPQGSSGGPGATVQKPLGGEQARDSAWRTHAERWCGKRDTALLRYGVSHHAARVTDLVLDGPDGKLVEGPIKVAAF